MGARACLRIALFLSCTVGGTLLTTPPTAPVASGIGAAEARSHGRHYRHGRSARRSSARRGRRAVAAAVAAVIVDVPPSRDLHLPTSAAGPLDGPDDVRLQKLRQALVEKASILAGAPRPEPPTPVRPADTTVETGPAAKSVSFDFEVGLKTTLFEDGASVREPFDVALARRLAAPPPVPKAAAVPAS